MCVSVCICVWQQVLGQLKHFRGNSCGKGTNVKGKLSLFFFLVPIVVSRTISISSYDGVQSVDYKISDSNLHLELLNLIGRKILVMIQSK